MSEFEVTRYPDRDKRHEEWMAAYEVVWRTQQGSEYISVPFSYEQFLEHRLSKSEQRIKELEKAHQAPDAGSGSGRDALLRGDLYNRVQEVLDLALFYLPGELGEFPDKVQQTVADFKNYRNLAEKQIQERDAQLAATQEREKARKTL